MVKLTTSPTFQIIDAKFYVPVLTLSINGNIKFLEYIKIGFKKTIFWKKHRSKITTQPRKNLDYLIDPKLITFFLLSFENGNDDSRIKLF